MKWLGKIEDPKDLTTKEYVDTADTKLQKSLEDLEENKLDADDIKEYSAEEVATLWKAAFAK